MNSSRRRRFFDRKGWFLFLSALLFIASYRPATCLLSLASLSSDGSSGRGFSSSSKERPRPTRQQSLTRTERVEAIRVQRRSPGADRDPSIEAAASVVPGSAIIRARTALLQPDYLRPDRSIPPRAPLSPPAL